MIIANGKLQKGEMLLFYGQKKAWACFTVKINFFFIHIWFSLSWWIIIRLTHFLQPKRIWFVKCIWKCLAMQALQSYGSRSNELFKKRGRDLPRNLQWIFEYDSIAVFAIFQSVKRGKGEYVVSSIHLLCLQCHKQPEEPFEVSLCNRRKWWIPENCLWHMCVSCAVYRCLLVNLNNRKKYFGFFLAVAAAAVVIQSLFGTLVFCLLDFIAVLLCKSLLMHTLCTWCTTNVRGVFLG